MPARIRRTPVSTSAALAVVRAVDAPKRKAVVKPAPHTVLPSDPMQRKVLAYLAKNGQSHVDTMADHIGSDSQFGAEEAIENALRVLRGAKLVRAVSPGVWALV